MRFHSRALHSALVIAACLIYPHSASATFDNLKTYKTVYPGKDAKAYSCKVCHLGAVGKLSDLNGYGKALQQLPDPTNHKKLTEEDFRAAETLDPDADGVPTLKELEAGTDPMDATSVPKSESGGAEPALPPDGSSSVAPAHPTQVLSRYLQQLVGPDAWAEPAGSDDSPEAGTPETASSPAPHAEYVGTETCAACHAKEFNEFKHSTHSRISLGDNVKAQGCETCHGPGSLHVEAGGGRGVGGIINPRKDPSTCFECHSDKRAEFRLPHHHPLLEGKMSCADCHSPHGEDVRPWSATTLKDINEACFKCHKEQRGPFVWEHEALREGCTTCHKVHGSIHEKMLIARDSTLCLRCHTQANFPTIGMQNHGTRLPQGTCFSAGCHTAVHGSNFDDHLRY